MADAAACKWFVLFFLILIFEISFPYRPTAFVFSFFIILFPKFTDYDDDWGTCSVKHMHCVEHVLNAWDDLMEPYQNLNPFYFRIVLIVLIAHDDSHSDGREASFTWIEKLDWRIDFPIPDFSNYELIYDFGFCFCKHILSVEIQIPLPRTHLENPISDRFLSG